MSFSSLILEYLKNHTAVSVAGFGTFYLRNTNATIETGGKSILPPGKEVAFKNDFQGSENDLSVFIAGKKNISPTEAAAEIQKQVTFWNLTLEKDENLTVENLGVFFLNDSQIHFIGERIESFSPDYYGLEEITLSDIKSLDTSTTKNSSSYRISTAWYWLVPLVLVAAALTYLGISQPETIFGKKSFGQSPAAKPEQKTIAVAAKTDSTLLRSIPSDSLRTDSVKTPNTAAAPAKKYPTSKWKK